jgi:hypothetical protein
MSLPARYRAPRTARLAVSGHMNDCDLETQSWLATDRIICRRTTRPTGFRTTYVEAWFNGLGTRTSKMCGWSMSLTGFGVAKLRAAVRAMPKQYDGAGIQMATQCHITSLPGVPRKQIAILLAIRQIVAISEISPRAPGCYR